MRRDNTKVLARTRPTQCKGGSNLYAKGRVAEIFNDRDS
jgi:hypothetical protein